jgi:CRP/FNR family transcriptional regulator, anaerobic regulatory protein
MNEDLQISLLAEHFPFWPNLTSEQKNYMLSHAALLCYRKGTNIHSGENECVGLMLVKSGELRVYMLSEEGREITLYRLREGDVCVLSASCVLSTITFDVHVDADQDSEVLLVNASAFAELSRLNVYVEKFSYQLATERFSDVMWTMQQVLFMSFDKRLAIFLLDEMNKTEEDIIRLTHEQIAKYVGTAREVVTRMLKYFSEEGIVSLSRGGIKVLDKKRLRSLTE